MDEEEYYNIKSKLNNICINYYTCDFKDLININKKYDTIILSNILSFIENDEKELKNIKEILDKISNDNSTIVLSYLYSGLMNSSKDIIYNKNKIAKYFNDLEYEYKYFDSSELCSDIYSLFNKDQDGVLIKKR